MDPILYMVIVGGIAGWLAGLLMKGGGFGIILNILLGIVGGIVGGYLFGALKISIGTGMVNDIITSAIGAAVILFIAGLFKK